MNEDIFVLQEMLLNMEEEKDILVSRVEDLNREIKALRNILIKYKLN